MHCYAFFIAFGIEKFTVNVSVGIHLCVPGRTDLWALVFLSGQSAMATNSQ